MLLTMNIMQQITDLSCRKKSMKTLTHALKRNIRFCLLNKDNEIMCQQPNRVTDKSLIKKKKKEYV